jgi:xeroderma pigmentosum group C-complementing protein
VKARDNIEDEELQVNQMMEGMPTSMAGFKGHPL